MYTYITTYHFATTRGSSKERPIYYAYRDFLHKNKAECDGTTSTAYFKYDGNIKDLCQDILNYFDDWEEDITYIESNDVEEMDIISLFCVNIGVFNGIHRDITDAMQIVNGESVEMPHEVRSLFCFSNQNTPRDIIGGILD